MLILIIETSTEKGLIALAKDSKVLKSKQLPGGKELSKNLAQETHLLLDGQIPNLIAVGTGPGSYTGTRVGVALGIGLKMGFQAEITGFSSLEAFAPAPVLFDARSGGFFALIEGKTELLKENNPKLKDLPLTGSPHPDMIKKRLPHLNLEERFPDANRLAELVWGGYKNKGPIPIKLDYLSSP